MLLLHARRDIRGIEGLVPNAPMEHADWLEQIEVRRQMLLPWLKTMALGNLGQVHCLDLATSNHYGRLDEYGHFLSRHVVANSAGIYRLVESAEEPLPNSGFRSRLSAKPDAIKYLWGLNVEGRWLVVKIKVRGVAGYKDRGAEELQAVEVTEVELEDMLLRLPVDHREVWETLGGAITANADRCRNICDRAEALEREAEIQATIVAARVDPR